MMMMMMMMSNEVNSAQFTMYSINLIMTLTERQLNFSPSKQPPVQVFRSSAKGSQNALGEPWLVWFMPPSQPSYSSCFAEPRRTQEHSKKAPPLAQVPVARRLHHSNDESWTVETMGQWTKTPLRSVRSLTSLEWIWMIITPSCLCWGLWSLWDRFNLITKKNDFFAPSGSIYAWLCLRSWTKYI